MPGRRRKKQSPAKQPRKSASRSTPKSRKKASTNYQRARQLIDGHAPLAKLKANDRKDILNALASGASRDMLVISADIRKSTFVMKEAVESRRHARILSEYIGSTRDWVQRHGGWWDKFTGDGFLCYWFMEIVDDNTHNLSQSIRDVLHVCSAMMEVFESKTIPELRANSRSFPAGVGLSLGIDAGPASVVEIANDLTIMGAPVVGAVRMVDVATAGEVVTNVYVGEYLERHAFCCFHDAATIVKEYRKTKEYSDGQEVFVLRLNHEALRG